LVPGSEEYSDDQAGEESAAGKIAEVAVVDDGQREEGQGHTEEIEEEWGDVAEGVLDEGEGGSPDYDYGKEQEIGQGGWA